MIVTRECVKPEPFKPVHIELETQEELNEQGGANSG